MEDLPLSTMNTDIRNVTDEDTDTDTDTDTDQDQDHESEVESNNDTDENIDDVETINQYLIDKDLHKVNNMIRKWDGKRINKAISHVNLKVLTEIVNNSIHQHEFKRIILLKCGKDINFREDSTSENVKLISIGLALLTPLVICDYSLFISNPFAQPFSVVCQSLVLGIGTAFTVKCIPTSALVFIPAYTLGMGIHLFKLIHG